MMSDVVLEAKAIRDSIQGLLDRVNVLEDLLGLGDDDVSLIMRCTGLTKTEAMIVSLLRKRRVALGIEIIHQAVYGGRAECDQPDLKTIQVMMTHIRRKLRAVGIAIQTVFCVGYTMDETNRYRLTAMMNALIEEPKAVV